MTSVNETFDGEASSAGSSPEMVHAARFSVRNRAAGAVQARCDKSGWGRSERGFGMRMYRHASEWFSSSSGESEAFFARSRMARRRASVT